ncbi:metallophosphoesterase family protein [Eubacterium xylanophilum]|uniref:metallophosphoesterase family protein n=1 Tax=Eubacterium xylanophilum TaxID=39497 RepID=UPI00047AF2AB|nr:DNA repair exonuclease [Eubacterium xylanophilum]
MKILHCADLHLDSKMNSNLDRDKAKERRLELLNTFKRMVDYASDCGIGVILIAGDMFDTKNISATTRNEVLRIFENYKDINFYYLKGNHDNDNFLAGIESLPENLYMFDEEWREYEELDGRVVISGIELSRENSSKIYNSLVLDASKFNIVMLHGQEAESDLGDKTEVINLRELRNKGIDYLALGHVHKPKIQELDPRAKYCYPGCLEGRGFDECGPHGFVVLDIDENTMQYSTEFADFATRRLYEVGVDVTGCNNSWEMIERARSSVRHCECKASDLVKIVLEGAVDVECEKNLDYIEKNFEDDFYYVKVKDETTISISADDYRFDESLKGEFVRSVLEDDNISEEDKRVVIRYGLQVLAGEEVM